MKITLVQTILSWEDQNLNLQRLSTLLDQILDTDLIVLPEMFTTGFTMNVNVAENFHENMHTLSWMRRIAKEKGAALVGSVSVHERGKYYNRLIWMFPEGHYVIYDKGHTFKLAGEDKHYEQGSERFIIEYNGWKILPLICYDLRFPEWSRNGVSQAGDCNYDLLIYVANWPAVRSYAWKSLLVARAIENVCYVAGVNRVGTDGNGNNYSGDSSLIDPLGEKIWTKENTGGCITLELDYQKLGEIRKRFPFLEDIHSNSC
jgi:predicted amidohydrolase